MKPIVQKKWVFTLGYFPFIMGGDVWQPMKTEVDCKGPYDVGRGYGVYVITAPNGRKFIAEMETGAFVGPSLQKVRSDVKRGDSKLMTEQIVEAKSMLQRAMTVTAEEFWRKLKCWVE